jgi:hypothetical protein
MCWLVKIKILMAVSVRLLVKPLNLKAYRHAGLERLTVMGRASFSAKLPPAKPKNVDRRAREYLTPSEVDQLIRTARKVGRYGHRDAT